MFVKIKNEYVNLEHIQACKISRSENYVGCDITLSSKIVRVEIRRKDKDSTLSVEDAENVRIINLFDTYLTRMIESKLA